MELPFLYGYGPLVWKALLVVLVLLSLALVAALRSWLARRGARRALAALVPTELCEGDVVLRGKIVQGSASTLAQELEQSSERSSGLVIVHEGVRVVIEGDVKVTHGSRARRWWLRPPRGVNAKWCWSSMQRTVVVGDEVTVSGTLARVPDVAGYRDSASHWELAGNDGPAMIAACRSQTKALPLGMGRWLAGTVLFGLIWYGMLHYVGTAALERARSDDSMYRTLAPADALAIAAAMPGSRDEAFELLVHRLESSFEKTEGAFQLRLKLREERGECSAYALFRAARFEEAAEAARRCDRSLLPHALMFLGRYREAAARVALDSKMAAIAAIVEGRWADAAPYADEVAKDYASRSPVGFVTKESLLDRASAARCVAALFRTWGGNRRASETGDDQNAGCITARALASPVSLRGEALANAASRILSEGYDDRAWAYRARELALVMGHHGNDDFSFYDADRWFVPFVLEANPDAPPHVRARMHEKMSLLEIERGNLASADRHARQAFELIPPDWDNKPVRSTVSLLTTSARVDPRDVEYVFVHAAEIRSGAPLEHRDVSGVYPKSCEPAYAQAIEDARHGDGRALAAVHRRCTVHAHSVPTILFAVLPLVDRGRGELARALRFHREGSTFDINFPFLFLQETWSYREISRMVGDMDEYERWKAIYDRHAAVLADREKLIALTILNEL